jgi:hypothetical protein
MYYGGGAKTKVNNDSLPLTSDFVSLALKGRTDSFALKGGDATAGLLRTMYDGPRPDRKIAGTCDPTPNGPHTARNVELQTCDGSADQSWGFLKNGRSIGSGEHCLDISAYGTKKGSKITAYYPCNGPNTKQNENWALRGSGSAVTIASLQNNTPFCVGLSGTQRGALVELDSRNATSLALKVGYTQTAGAGNGTIVQEASGLCLTKMPFPPPPPPPPGPQQSYQPMRKRGAIILATGGDQSNSAAGNFYVRSNTRLRVPAIALTENWQLPVRNTQEGFMATGVTSDTTDAAVQKKHCQRRVLRLEPPDEPSQLLKRSASALVAAKAGERHRH